MGKENKEASFCPFVNGKCKEDDCMLFVSEKRPDQPHITDRYCSIRRTQSELAMIRNWLYMYGPQR
jgi:hypothetical protein